MSQSELRDEFSERLDGPTAGARYLIELKSTLRIGFLFKYLDEA